MDNNLYYSVAEKKDPRNPEQEGLYYAHTRTKGVLDTKGLIERIRNRGHCGESGHCGSADNDGGYCDGSAVQRGDRGCRSKEEFDSKHITKVRAIFKEGRTLRCGMATVHFKKVE